MTIIHLCDTFNLSIEESMFDLIDETRAAKIKKIKDVVKQKEKLFSSLLLNELIIQTLGSSYDIKYTTNGKPFIDHPNFHFSVAHSNGVICIGISKKNIGVDIELIKPITEKLVNKVLSDEELQIYKTLKPIDKTNYFFESFTAKESYVKQNDLSMINPKAVIYDQVVTKTFKKNKNIYQISLSGDESFSILERYYKNHEFTY